MNHVLAKIGIMKGVNIMSKQGAKGWASWRDKANLIANHYGYENQREQLIEELSELILSAQKVKRAKRDIEENQLTESRKKTFYDAQNNFIEEIADVEVMIYQMKYFLGKENVNAVIERKINRQMERIKK